MQSVQDYARDIIVEELQKKLGTEVGIKRLKFQPFNSLSLDSVYLYDRNNNEILLANEISANFDLFHLIQNRLVITSARISDFEVNLSKPSARDSLNIQFIIDAFKPKEESSNQKLELKINSLSLANGKFKYDVEDKPHKKGRFDENHIYISNLNTRLSLKSVVSDSLNIQIKRLNLHEQSGLEIKNLSSRLLTQGKKASLRGFQLDLPNSSLKLNTFEVNLDSVANYEFDCEVAPSYIAPKDISAFIPELKNFNDLLSVYVHTHGSLDDINVSEISLKYGDDMKLLASGEIKDIRDKDNLYILGSIDNFTINKKGIEGLINNFSATRQILPSYINEVGIISFEGDLSGYLSQLTAFGSLTSDVGNIKTDVLFGFNPKKGVKSYVEGKVYANSLKLGKLTGNNKLDEASLSLSLRYSKPTYGPSQGHMEGTIHKFDYKGYSYRDITIDTDYSGLKLNGMLNINDPNGSLNVKGLFDLSDKEKPALDFEAQAKNIQLDSLRLLENMKQSYLSFNINANFSGKNIDESDGYIKIDSLDFIREDKVFQMQKFLLETSGMGNERRLSIKSDIINGEILGAYSSTTIANSVKKTFLPYLSILETEEKERTIKESDLTFNFQINNTEALSKILNLPVTILSQSKLIGFYNNNNDKFKIEVFAPSLIAAGKEIKSGYILAENPRNEVAVKIDGAIVGKNNVMTDLSVNSSLVNNNINTTISFENNNVKKAKGKFTFLTSLTKDEEERLNIDINILPGELLLNSLSWKMDESTIHIHGDKTIQVDNLYAHSIDGSQAIKINGKYSANNPTDILKTELKNIELEYVFQTLAIDVLKFGGKTTGNVFLSTIEGKPYANTRIDVEDFSFNGTHLGHLNLFSEFDDDTKKVMMEGTILNKENKKTLVDGFVDPINQKLNIGFDADSIDISFLGLYAATLFDKVQGRGTGKVLLTGNFSKVTVEGKAYIQDGQIGINFLNTNYTFTDTVYLKKDLIYFNNVKFYDQNNNYAIGNGKVAHDYFADFMYFVDMTANNFMVYNATEKVNPIFFGKVFGSGNAEISGDEREVNINVRMRTESNTLVRMNFMEEEVNQYSFITYKNDINPTDSISTTDNTKPKPIQTSSGMAINMNFYVDATPDAVVELVMDPIGGDVIRGSGSGTMDFVWSTKTSPLLYGNFLINRGSYNFTFQKLLERKFTILDGSNVQFTGDPFSAQLDVQAMYKLTANLNDLDKDLVRNSGQTNIPVNCLLHLTGPLKHPNVNLDLAFPSADPEISRQIKNLLNTEDMINKQVAYLLLMSKFYTPSSANVEHRTSDFAAVASATLSNQLTKLISQIDDRWQVGTNIRTSDSEFSNTEIELLLSSQLLDDRLIINGNFGYREDKNRATNQEAFIGDVDIEYLLNNSGTWRVKAYNHYNEKFYYLDNAKHTQGIGIMYKKDFDKVQELFVRKPKTVNPIDSIPPAPADTLRSYIQIKK